MKMFKEFEGRLPTNSRKVFREIDSPFAIQEYLYSMPYNAESRDRSPLNVMLDKQCHCLDGGFLAAFMLWKLGFKPLILDILPDPGMDDDHVLALYQIEGRWGAVAKSNYVNLGFREPVYKNLRELVMTYFEHYVSANRAKTLRGYTRPLDLARYVDKTWPYDEPAANRLYKKFYTRKPIRLITHTMAGRLNLVRESVYEAEILGTDMNWVYGIREE